MDIHIRKATLNDLVSIVQLLYEDEISQEREALSTPLDACYVEAFHAIDRDPIL